MSCSTLLPPVQLRLDSTTTTKKYTWFTGWMPCMAMDDASGTLKLVGVLGALRGQVAYQFAVTRTDKPSAPVAIGTQQTADGEYFYSTTDFNIGAVAPGNSFVRFGVAHDLSAAPNQGVAEATLQVGIRQCGGHKGAWSGHLETLTTSSKFVPITGWFHTLSVVKIQIATILASLGGNAQVTLTYRTATASPELPGNWDATGLGSTLTANGEANSGELTPTTTGKMWIQFGLKYELSSGSSLGQVDVSVLPMLRHS